MVAGSPGWDARSRRGVRWTVRFAPGWKEPTTEHQNSWRRGGGLSGFRAGSDTTEAATAVGHHFRCARLVSCSPRWNPVMIKEGVRALLPKDPMQFDAPFCGPEGHEQQGHGRDKKLFHRARRTHVAGACAVHLPCGLLGTQSRARQGSHPVPAAPAARASTTETLPASGGDNDAKRKSEAIGLLLYLTSLASRWRVDRPGDPVIESTVHARLRQPAPFKAVIGAEPQRRSAKRAGLTERFPTTPPSNASISWRDLLRWCTSAAPRNTSADAREKNQPPGDKRTEEARPAPDQRADDQPVGFGAWRWGAAIPGEPPYSAGGKKMPRRKPLPWRSSRRVETVGAVSPRLRSRPADDESRGPRCRGCFGIFVFCRRVG